jgi:Bacterial Ig-like domain (group 2)
MKPNLAAGNAARASRKGMSPQIIFLVFRLVAITVLTSCGGGTVGPTPPRQLISLTIQPNSSTATQGNTVPFSATGTFNQAPTTQTNLPVQWTSSDTNIATVDANTGTATCVSVGGPVNISASAAGKGGMVSGSATLACEVSPDPIATLTPSSLYFLCGNQINSQGQKVCSCKPSPAGNTATLTNTGGSDLDISQMISGGPLDFLTGHVISETDTCAGTTVIPGQSCKITVGVQWRGTGYLSGGVAIYDNALDSPQTLAITGVSVCN